MGDSNSASFIAKIFDSANKDIKLKITINQATI